MGIQLTHAVTPLDCHHTRSKLAEANPARKRPPGGVFTANVEDCPFRRNAGFAAISVQTFRWITLYELVGDEDVDQVGFRHGGIMHAQS